MGTPASPSYKRFKFSEKTGKDFSPAKHAWQPGGAQASLTWDVAWDDYLNDWPGKMLGYSSVPLGNNNLPIRDQGGFARLSRIIPYRHPIFPGLWATRITEVVPFGPNGMATSTCSENNDAYAAFNYVRATITFSSLPFAVLSDNSLASASSPQGVYDESLRYVQFTKDTRLETIKVENGSMAYAEGTTLPNNLGLLGKTVVATRFLYLVKQAWVLKWCGVCDAFLMRGGTPGLGNGQPSNLDACLGRVNTKTFLNHPPGTLLALGYKQEPQEAATDPVNCGSASNDYPPRLWDVSISILEFDSPVDPNVTPTVNPPNQGHNCLPAPQLVTPYYYYALSSPFNVPGVGMVGGNQPLYQGVDYNNLMFKSPN